MHRTNLTAPTDDGSWVALRLELPRTAGPGLRPWAANGNRIALSQGPETVLLATVDDDRGGVTYSRTDRYRSPVAPLRAAGAREVTGHGQPSWYARWAHRFADALEASPLGPLHEGPWVLSRQLARDGVPRAEGGPAGRWRSVLLDEHPDGCIDWFTGSWQVLPLRRIPSPDHGRVRAYRKQARDGTLPPVLLWWFSGLHCYLVLDGHARLAAAVAENREPPVLALSRALPEERTGAGRDKALATYQLTMSVLDGPHQMADRQGAARAASRLLAAQLHDLDVTHAPTRAWPVPEARPTPARPLNRSGCSGGSTPASPSP
ncbi:hypothetical protein ACFU6R_01690 [Streptomyces sp. NPDC057499]|uniref:hypothetical protein n=1 Tax=Streptomyces sp. NPDC057499 TaxID=3346150 RepID=UPI0036CD5341